MPCSFSSCFLASFVARAYFSVALIALPVLSVFLVLIYTILVSCFVMVSSSAFKEIAAFALSLMAFASAARLKAMPAAPIKPFKLAPSPLKAEPPLFADLLAFSVLALSLSIF